MAILNTINSQVRDPKLSAGSFSVPPISFWPRALTEKRGWLSCGGGATSVVNSVDRFYSKPKSMRAYFPMQHCTLWRLRDRFPSRSVIRVRGEGQDSKDPPHCQKGEPLAMSPPGSSQRLGFSGSQNSALTVDLGIRMRDIVFQPFFDLTSKIVRKVI